MKDRQPISKNSPVNDTSAIIASGAGQGLRVSIAGGFAYGIASVGRPRGIGDLDRGRNARCRKPGDRGELARGDHSTGQSREPIPPGPRYKLQRRRQIGASNTVGSETSPPAWSRSASPSRADSAPLRGLHPSLAACARLSGGDMNDSRRDPLPEASPEAATLLPSLQCTTTLPAEVIGSISFWGACLGSVLSRRRFFSWSFPPAMPVFPPADRHGHRRPAERRVCRTADVS
jgi:hypothetical protein